MWGKVVGVGVVIGLVLGSVALAGLNYLPGKQSSVLLDINDGAICTGTVVGKHTVLTAAHCFGEFKTGVIALDEGAVQPYTIVVDDGNDHVLLRIADAGSKRIASLGPAPRPGDPVYLWGNPHGVRDQLRSGYAQGYVRNFWGSPVITVFSFFTQPGDSGAGYFNSRGEVVAVHWGRHPDNNQAIALRLQFTTKQWRENVK